MVSLLPALGYRACVYIWQLLQMPCSFLEAPFAFSNTLALKYIIQRDKGPNQRPGKIFIARERRFRDRLLSPLGALES